MIRDLIMILCPLIAGLLATAVMFQCELGVVPDHRR